MTPGRRIRTALAGVLLALGLLPAAQADIYGYVDEKGVAHFAAEKIDERYQLFFRGGQSFDTSRGLAPSASGRAAAARLGIPGMSVSWSKAGGLRRCTAC